MGGLNGQLHILMVSQVFYPEVFRSNDLAAEWVKRGYKVTVLTGIPNYPQGEFFEGYDRKHRREEDWNGVHIIHVPVIPRGHSSLGMVRNYFSFVRYGKKWVRKNDVKADLVFNFETSPMMQTLVAIEYGRRYHVPVFLYVPPHRAQNGSAPRAPRGRPAGAEQGEVWEVLLPVRNDDRTEAGKEQL